MATLSAWYRVNPQTDSGTVQPSAAKASSSAKAIEDKFPGILRTLRFTALYFCRQKKSTDGNPCGLPSVALAKDGGRNRTRIYDLHDVNVAL